MSLTKKPELTPEKLAANQANGRLLALLGEEVEALEDRRAEEGEQLLETASPYYRDTLLASEDPRGRVTARMEESSLRQVERLTRLLKIKDGPTISMKTNAESKFAFARFSPFASFFDPISCPGTGGSAAIFLHRSPQFGIFLAAYLPC